MKLTKLFIVKPELKVKTLSFRRGPEANMGEVEQAAVKGEEEDSIKVICRY